MSITIVSFLATALAEIRAINAGDVASPDDQDLALIVFNELLDSLNATQRAVYAQTFTTYTLTANLQPHTIGPTGATFTATQRPESIEAANIVLTDVTPNIRVPLTLRDAAWWADQRAQGATSTVPTDVYYQKAWVNGSIYLWPKNSGTYGLELDVRVLLSSVVLTDTLNLPPGYQQALRLTLAELLGPSFGVSASEDTKTQARKARAQVWGNNDVIPRLSSDATPFVGGRGGSFNYLTGSVR